MAPAESTGAVVREKCMQCICSDMSKNCQCRSGQRSIKPGMLSLRIMEKQVWKDLERSFNPCLFPKADSAIPVSHLTGVCGQPLLKGDREFTPRAGSLHCGFSFPTFIKELKLCFYVKPAISSFICYGVRNKFPFGCRRLIRIRRLSSVQDQLYTWDVERALFFSISAGYCQST